MKQITFALLAAGLLALPATGCTRQGAQDQQQQEPQESVVPGEGGTMDQQEPMGTDPSQQQDQETILPQDQQDPSMQPPQDQQDPSLQPGAEQSPEQEPMGTGQ